MEMLDFNALLTQLGFDPGETLVVRHAPVEKSLKRVLPWLVIERPDLWLAYQRIQWRSLEKAMTQATYIASFVGQEAASATFAGLYRIGEGVVLDTDGYRAFPGNAELETLGMSGRTEAMSNCIAFDLEQLEHYAEWIGRLTIDWPPPHQQWWRWSGRNSFRIAAIEKESLFTPRMPEWRDIVLTWQELHNLPSTWQAALAEWRGIYMIYDTGRKAGYVGAAYGSENILGRWRNYAKTGHGGNRDLRSSLPADLRFSILQRTSPDLELIDIVALESSWKDRLHTRQFGLNRN